MRYIVDRFENEYAIVELDNGEFIDIPKKALPPDASEGSIIEVTTLSDETNVRRTEMKKKMNSLFRNE